MPPDALGPFRVLHQIGAGTLGPVFRALDPERDIPVAVKLFRLDLPPEQVHRLVAEFEWAIAAALRHPAIVTPIATGIQGNDAYLVQDYVAADSLDTAIRTFGPAPPSDAVRVAAQLAGALDFAAVVDVLHGALHPRDVLVAPEEARVTGFGVARALEQVGVTAPVRRPYAAPERMAGAAWDRRADVYSLAAVMHEMLWGRRVRGTGEQVAEWLADLPGADMHAVRAVFARGLADDPGARFPTALAFAEALNEAVATVSPGHAAARPEASRGLPVAPRLSLDEADPRHGEADLRLQGDAATGPDFDLRQADAPHEEGTAPYQDVEPAPAPPVIEPGSSSIRIDLRSPSRAATPEPPTVARPERPLVAAPIDVEETKASPREVHAARPPEAAADRSLAGSVAERSRSAVWPLMLALLVGVALGFAGGYGVGVRDRTQGASSPQPLAATPAPGSSSTPASPTPVPPPERTFTEGAVRESAPAAAPAPSSAARREPPPADGRLLVRSTPAGATVFVDGRDQGRTPVAVRSLSRGEHQVRIERDGYRPEERRVALSGADPSQSMTVELLPNRAAEPTTGTTETPLRFSGVLVVESRPPGAVVFVDGRRVGTTPLSMTQVDAGEHAVRLERSGYQRWSASVRIVAGARNRVTASLER